MARFRLIFILGFVISSTAVLLPAFAAVGSIPVTGSINPPQSVTVNAQPFAPMPPLKADQINQDLVKNGHAIFYNILFSSDKTEVKSESIPQLAEIAKVLKNNPDLRVFITVHTDNLGMLTYNLSLSQRRAQALVVELIKNYGIDARRMVPRGLAQLAPIATNETDKGRAQNQRVEIVELAGPL